MPFSITSPSPNAVISGPTVFRVSLGNLTRVNSIEYLLDRRQIYADGELVLPRRNAPSYDLSWHSANWFDGVVTVEAVARDASGNIINRTAPVPFKIANDTANVTLVSPDAATTLSGSVRWTMRTDHKVSTEPRQNHIWSYFVDGKETHLEYAPGQEYTYVLDTTKLRNGKHELFAVVVVEDARFNPYPVLGASLVTVNVNNGHTPMELRSNFKDVFLVPTEKITVTSRRVYTDGLEEPVRPTFTSSNPAVASVSPSGEVTALATGFAEVTASHAGLTSVTRVTVRDKHDFPHFTEQGKIVGLYGPDSMFLRTMFNTPPGEFTNPRNPNLGPLIRQAGVNAMTTGFYFNPADGAARDFTAWKAGIEPFHQEISRVAQENDLGIYLTGDDIARTRNELYDSICDSPDPEVCPHPTSQAKIRYALDWAANTPRVIGIDMIDEVSALWGDTPTPTDGRWQTPPPRLEDNSFSKLMTIMNSVNRPRITWTCLGAASPGTVKNWTGNPAFSDYNGIYHTIITIREAYPSGASMFQIIDGIDRATIGRNGSFLANAPSILLVSATGSFYQKNGPGDHFIAGQDTLLHPGRQVPQVAAEVVYALIRGISGVRVYSFDWTGWKDERTNAPIGRDLQTGGGPQGIGAQRWKSMSDAFNLIADLQPYLLQPPTHAIDLGNSVRTGAKRGPQGNVLIALNISETPETVHVDLKPYATSKPILRSRLLGGTGYKTETLPPIPADTLTLQPGEAVFWVSPR